MCTFLHIDCVIFVHVFLCCSLYVTRWCMKNMCFLRVLCVHNCNLKFHVYICHYNLFCRKFLPGQGD